MLEGERFRVMHLLTQKKKKMISLFISYRELPLNWKGLCISITCLANVIWGGQQKILFSHLFHSQAELTLVVQ